MSPRQSRLPSRPRSLPIVLRSLNNQVPDFHARWTLSTGRIPPLYTLLLKAPRRSDREESTYVFLGSQLEGSPRIVSRCFSDSLHSIFIIYICMKLREYLQRSISFPFHSAAEDPGHEATGWVRGWSQCASDWNPAANGANGAVGQQVEAEMTGLQGLTVSYGNGSKMVKTSCSRLVPIFCGINLLNKHSLTKLSSNSRVPSN